MKKTVSLFILLSVSVLGIICAVTGIIEPLEKEIASFINPNGESSILFRFFSYLGETAQVIIILVLLLIFPSRKKIGIPAVITVIIAFLSSQIIKAVVARQRPVERLIEISGYSFPSGHAMNAAALYIAVMLALLKICKNRKQKAVTVCVLSFIPFMIGLSRIYFTVHFATDVISGWCFGAIVAIIVDIVFEKNTN
ncbi:MAG: phosphatase PAP2 family protein [Clostridia bacterium]|nr:phosphatase PAP2 family protein [Clostridia bacterium]